MYSDKEKLTVGERFKRFRLQTGRSQAQLSEGICSYPVISQIECDRALPSAHTLGKLADRLGVPLREITGPEEGKMDVRFQLDVIRVHIANRDYSHALNLISELEHSCELMEHQLHPQMLSEELLMLKRAT